MAAATETLLTTPLHARHRAAGGRLVPFAGWEMPVEYAGIRAEHLAVRTRAGVFDVSHMGQVETSGPDAERFLQRVLSNDVTRLEEGRAQYSLLCRDDGGVLDDLFTYRIATDRYLTVTNAANHARDFAWLSDHAGGFDVAVSDVAADHAMLALQGPAARSILDRRLEGEAPARMRVATGRVAGVECLVCGTGYTGEDGVELLCAPDGAEALRDALTSDGAAPAGLGARDTLRLEVCYPLHGNDITPDTDAISAGLGWVCALDAKEFTGADELQRIKAEGPPRKLAAFVMEERAIPRNGMPILEGGVVTSGTHSPMLDAGIGMGYVPAAVAAPESRITIDVRGRERAARVVKKPIYKREDSA